MMRRLREHADLQRHPAHGRQARSATTSAAIRQYAADPGARARPSSASSTCTRSRSTYDPAELRESTLDLRGDALRDRARPGALDASSSRATSPRSRRGGLAAVGGDELRPARPDDAVQGEVASSEDFVSAALFTYPVLMAGDILLYQHRRRPDRRRPAPAPRAHARHRASASTRATARRSSCPKASYPEIGGADHGPPGARRRRCPRRGGSCAGNRAHARPARRDPEEGQERRDGLRPRGAPRPEEQGRDLEPDRDHDRRDRRVDRRRSRPRYDGAGYGRLQGGRRRGGRRDARPRSRRATASSATTPAELDRLLAGRRREGRARPRRRRSS